MKQAEKEKKDRKAKINKRIKRHRERGEMEDKET